MKQPITHLVLDMDGVLWHGETPVPGMADFFDTVRRLDIGFVLATNNAGKTAAQFSEKLARFGVDIPPAQILTSAETTAVYLADHYPPGTRVYVIGTTGLQQALAARGFVVVSAEEVRASATTTTGAAAELVVVGYTPSARYEDFALGSLLIHRGARFIGTNPDPSLPTELGPMPGAGALLAVLEMTTGVRPLIIGKPEPIIFHEAVRRLGAAAATTAMVGDRLSTDITGAKRAGLQAVLVLSGISTREEAAAEPVDVRPDYIFDDITALAEYLSHGQR